MLFRRALEVEEKKLEEAKSKAKDFTATARKQLKAAAEREVAEADKEAGQGGRVLRGRSLPGVPPQEFLRRRGGRGRAGRPFSFAAGPTIHSFGRPP